jgi:hypothetical protein
MPRKIADREINNMRRVIEILETHSPDEQKRMIWFIVGSLQYRNEKSKIEARPR